MPRQFAGLFVAEERGSHELKGVPEPVACFAGGTTWKIIRAILLRFIGIPVDRSEEFAQAKTYHVGFQTGALLDGIGEKADSSNK